MKLDSIEKKLNKDFNLKKSQYFLVIKLTNSKDAGVDNYRRTNESGIDFVARNISAATLTIIPGWTRLEDEYEYSLYKNQELVLTFKDFNSGYGILSILFFPYFFFRSVDDVIYLRINYIIKKNMEIYFQLDKSE